MCSKKIKDTWLTHGIKFHELTSILDIDTNYSIYRSDNTYSYSSFANNDAYDIDIKVSNIDNTLYLRSVYIHNYKNGFEHQQDYILIEYRFWLDLKFEIIKRNFDNNQNKIHKNTGLPQVSVSIKTVIEEKIETDKNGIFKHLIEFFKYVDPKLSKIISRNISLNELLGNDCI